MLRRVVDLILVLSKIDWVVNHGDLVGHNWADPTTGGEIVEPLQVIAAPRRLRILELIWDRELSAGEIAAQFDVSWSAVSQHLTVLRRAGFVTERREGTSRIYQADRAGLGSLRGVIEEYWRASLLHVKELAETEERGRGHT